eukprot:TRINITY_DN58177_c0_g2_i1.p1 TRINITY_DN58177_c0_g2~~TRINITY_DN58177_c0_g2_i1.p1  ORF type:complete len:437 (-),score=24.93 TRINITY_DN58177_c0_g2_i1:150-1460(-)
MQLMAKFRKKGKTEGWGNKPRSTFDNVPENTPTASETTSVGSRRRRNTWGTTSIASQNEQTDTSLQGHAEDSDNDNDELLLYASQRSQSIASQHNLSSSSSVQITAPPESLASSARVRICSWNVAGTSSFNLTDNDWMAWLGFDPEASPPHLLIIGLQEVDMSLAALVRNNTNKAQLWRDQLQKYLAEKNMTMIVFRQLMGLVLCVFVCNTQTKNVSGVEDLSAPTGWFGKCGNKGGVLCHFQLDDDHYCIVNSHLAPHQNKVQQRNENYNTILTKSMFASSPHAIMGHDYVFWFGDLNYRLDLQRDQVSDLLTNLDQSQLLQSDQLNKQMQQRAVFRSFNEAGIEYAPTYKFHKRTDTYNQKRCPAYCDRILWFERSPSLFHGSCKHQTVEAADCPNCKQHCKVKCSTYTSLPQLCTSDHKPIAALFCILDALST